MTDRPDVYTLVDQLCAVHQQRQPYEYEYTNRAGSTTRYEGEHVTTCPGLIDQLRESVGQSATAEGGGARPGFGSKPTARIDAIDALHRIDLSAGRWVRDMGEDDPADTVACIRKLAGLLPSAEDATRKAVEADIRRWWTWARIVTGWDTPAWNPNNTCPLCAARGGLRVRFVEQIATCTNCHEAWSPVNVGLLADHIRAENRDVPQDPEAAA